MSVVNTLNQLHDCDNLLQGGLSIDHIVFNTEEEDIYFTDWSNATSLLDCHGPLEVRDLQAYLYVCRVYGNTEP